MSIQPIQYGFQIKQVNFFQLFYWLFHRFSRALSEIICTPVDLAPTKSTVAPLQRQARSQSNIHNHSHKHTNTQTHNQTMLNRLLVALALLAVALTIANPDVTQFPNLNETDYTYYRDPTTVALPPLPSVRYTQTNFPSLSTLTPATMKLYDYLWWQCNYNATCMRGFPLGTYRNLTWAPPSNTVISSPLYWTWQDNKYNSTVKVFVTCRPNYFPLLSSNRICKSVAVTDPDFLKPTYVPAVPKVCVVRGVTLVPCSLWGYLTKYQALVICC